jgi:hypothetical protein
MDRAGGLARSPAIDPIPQIVSAIRAQPTIILRLLRIKAAVPDRPWWLVSVFDR